MMKKWIAILMVLAMTVLLAGCGIKKVGNVNDDADGGGDAGDDITGGWEIVESPAAAELPAEVKTQFDAFMQDYGGEVIPMAYFGRLMKDGGTSYMLLCKDNDVDELQVFVVGDGNNPDLADGIIYTLDIGSYTEDAGAKINTEPQAGVWEIPEDHTKGTLPEDVQAAFDQSSGQAEGFMLTPMAYLGSQVVAGTNYAILCCGETTAEDSVTCAQIVTVYQDLEGKAEITNICTLDLAEFAE